MSSNPAFKRAEIVRVPANLPGLAKKDRSSSSVSSGGDGRVWEAAFPPGHALDPRDPWALSRLKPVDWEGILKRKSEVNSKNPWSL